MLLNENGSIINMIYHEFRDTVENPESLNIEIRSADYALKEAVQKLLEGEKVSMLALEELHTECVANYEEAAFIAGFKIAVKLMSEAKI